MPTYVVQGELFYKSTTNGTDFKCTFAVPSGSGAGLYHAVYIGSGGSAVVADTNAWADTILADATSAGNVYGIRIQGLLAVGSSSGTFSVNWAASSGSPTTTLTSRSFILMHRVG